MKSGKVYLIGAGPGAPDLLTLRAYRLLQQADILLYDRLVDPEVIDYAVKAEKIFVGKNKGDDMQKRQERIFALMIGHAQAGRTVVRLKGGDPFVFGRGGEELMVLAEAGVQGEVVPGVTSCVSAPESALIPVTYRGISASFGVFAGQPGTRKPAYIDWEAAARIGTAVFLMGVERLETIVGKLLEHGRDAQTPVALIERGTLPGQKVATGTLADIVERAAHIAAPATIVVGEVVTVRERLLQLQQFAAEDQWVAAG
ncbi:uroporphyrinogen-III C-methyltransferase [Acanthopleuribacter pedis]|uniref:uroporphyrinogen-III C-methyltransferase n=1 Tax=Acanthopleuribacter pedis TaxID=442870 RepID=A0A8J7U3A5_9BACT|nr:uroporphyrinogen-III C-methyltransferase [Acanthopleuribacter pedis]MBO1318133.1 uroporphyrinogen-III C-methyltransferase [Acanthopleuribacter pedis]